MSRECRREIGGGHDRVADNLAQVSATWTIYLRFAVETGAISSADAEKIQAEVLLTLKDLAAEQQGLQRAHDPVARFITLLNSVLSAGKAHIGCARHPGRKPDVSNPAPLGWRQLNDMAWVANGPCVGWLAHDGVYLDPDAAYAAAQQQAGPHGEAITVECSTLQKRLHQRKLLVVERRDEDGGIRLRARKNVGDHRQRVWHLPHKILDPLSQKTAPTAPTAPTHENRQENQGDE